MPLRFEDVPASETTPPLPGFDSLSCDQDGREKAEAPQKWQQATRRATRTIMYVGEQYSSSASPLSGVLPDGSPTRKRPTSNGENPEPMERNAS
jgi:hypothetical protein